VEFVSNRIRVVATRTLNPDKQLGNASGSRHQHPMSENSKAIDLGIVVVAKAR
jgi:hypothetical protein